MGISHQFSGSSSGFKTLRHVVEVVGAGIELDEMRTQKPILNKEDGPTARHRRRQDDRTGNKSDESDGYGERNAYCLFAIQQSIPPPPGRFMSCLARIMRAENKI